MSRNRILKTALLALATVGVLSCLLVGCKKEEKPAPDFSDPAVRMKDPGYRAELDAQRAVAKKSIGARNEIAREMSRRADEMKKKLGTHDLKVAEKELEKTTEWQKLKADYAKAQAEVDANRRATAEMIRTRMMTKPISK